MRGPASTSTPTTALALCAALVAAAAVRPAEAGRGGSSARITNAIASGSADAIIAELERAERLVCSQCITVVMPLLEHDSYRVREAAAWWFARRPAQKQELGERAEADLALGDSIRARNAADILGTFRHPQAVPALSAAAQRLALSAEARAHAVMALGHIGHASAAPAISAALADPEPRVRAEAVRAWHGIRYQQGAAPLLRVLADPERTVRREAVAVIGALRETGARAELERLVQTDTDPFVRRNACFALGRLGDPAARAALEAGAKDASPVVRGTCRVALRQLR
jgi:HEAT repeat protein